MRLLDRTAPLALLLAACAPGGVPCPAAPPPRAAPAVAAPSTTPPAAAPRLDVTVTPRVAASSDGAPVASVDVEVVAASERPAELRRWSLASGPLDALRIRQARDEAGDLPIEITREARLALTFTRPPRGEVRLAYTLRAAPMSTSAGPVVEADPDRFRAAGEALLVLPDALDERAVPTSLHLRSRELGANDDRSGAASSFGAGADRDFAASGNDLRFGTYLAGPMGTAVFHAPEGHDEAAWLGYTTFDPRPIAADLAAFRTAVRQLLDEPDAPRLTVLFAADARPVGAFVAARRASSVLLQVGVAEGWSAPVRIAAAAEILHGWLGTKLWIGPSERAREAEAYWFTEGVTRHLARDLLFRFGLVTPAEMLDEVHGLAGLAATSPHRGLTNAELGARPKEPGVLPLLVARGALYGALVDARLRSAAPRDAASKAPRSLDELLRGLVAEARGRRGPLPVSAWLDAVTKALGADEAPVLAEHVERGRPAALPEGALGPCFRTARRRYEAFDLGFDLDATNAAKDHALHGLRADGPAARAGAKEGDVLIGADLVRGRADRPAKLTLKRGDETVALSFRPAGASGQGQGWTRVRGLPDEACMR
jgi:hypothetical protein